MNWIHDIEHASRSGLKSALCTVVSVKGSAPRSVGAKMIVYEDGSVKGTIGGGNLEKKVIENALQQISSASPQLFRHDLLHQLGMCCGGTVEIFIEPVQMISKLYIFGAGHTGKALAKLAVDLDFETYIIDDRDEYIAGIDFKGVYKMNLHYSQALPVLPFNENTYVVIMTYDHSYDRDILGYCIKKATAYLGMIGSKRKVELTKKMFAAAKVATVEELSRVDMPVGLDICAETPAEIAVSIMAGIIKVRNSVNSFSKTNSISRNNESTEESGSQVMNINS